MRSLRGPKIKSGTKSSKKKTPAVIERWHHMGSCATSQAGGVGSGWVCQW
jgi:hypothetical protein